MPITTANTNTRPDTWVWVVWNERGNRVGAGIETDWNAGQANAEDKVARYRHDYGTDIRWQIIPLNGALIDAETVLAATRMPEARAARFA
jgi:hypothetical protein